MGCTVAWEVSTEPDTVTATGLGLPGFAAVAPESTYRPSTRTVALALPVSVMTGGRFGATGEPGGSGLGAAGASDASATAAGGAGAKAGRGAAGW